MSPSPKLDAEPPVRLPDPPADNQRRHVRRPLAVRCWLTDGRHTVYLRVHDLSRGGLAVRAPVPFRVAKPIDIRIDLPGGGEVHARGYVVWLRPATDAPSGPRMGVRFVEFLTGASDLARLLGTS